MRLLFAALCAAAIIGGHAVAAEITVESFPIAGNRPHDLAPESAKFKKLRRYVVQMKARRPRPTVLTHCYHWICITPYGMCTPWVGCAASRPRRRNAPAPSPSTE